MNIFYLHSDPIQNAKWYIDKHIVKMPTEYCQLLSSAHRIIDGKMYQGINKNKRNVKKWKLPDQRENLLMQVTHANHPSNIWVRHSRSNYIKLWKIYISCLSEFSYRYNKVHGANRLSLILMSPPKKLEDLGMTTIPQAMPDYCKIPGNTIGGYRNFYKKEKKNFATWKKRSKPKWFNT